MIVPELHVVRSSTNSPTPCSQDSTGASAVVEVVAENVKSPPSNGTLRTSHSFGLRSTKRFVQCRRHGRRIDPPVLVDIGRAISGVECTQVQDGLTRFRFHPGADIGRRLTQFSRKNGMPECGSSCLDFLADDTDVEAGLAHRIERHPRTGLASSIQESVIGQFAQGPVHRCPGAAEFAGQIGLVGNVVAGLPDALDDPATDFVLHACQLLMGRAVKWRLRGF